jgi:hypothetical protein
VAPEHFFIFSFLLCVVFGVLSCVLSTLDLGPWTFGIRGKLEMEACGVSEEHYTAHVAGTLMYIAAVL